LTTARWHVKDKKVQREELNGERWTEIKKLKAICLVGTGIYDQIAYGTDTPCSQHGGRCQTAWICSPLSQLLVIDVDSEEFDPTELGQHLTEHGYRPISTRGADRGLPNRHYAVDMRPMAGRWVTQGHIPGGDIKSNGFVPMPGSTHPSGDTYKPQLNQDDNLEIIDCTEELYALLLQAREDGKEQVAASGQNGRTGARSGLGGGQNSSLYSLVGWLIHAWKPKDQARGEWLAAAGRLELTDPSWPWTEADFENMWNRCLADHLRKGNSYKPDLYRDVSEALMRWALKVHNTPVKEASPSAENTSEAVPKVLTGKVIAPAEATGSPEALGDSAWLMAMRGTDVPMTVTDICAETPDQFGMAHLADKWFGAHNGWVMDSQRFMVFDPAQGYWSEDGKCHESVCGRVSRLGRVVRQRVAAKIETLDEKNDKELIKILLGYNAPFKNYNGVRGVVSALSVEGQHLDPLDFNTDSSLLNFANGTYDVRTGTMHDHNPADKITHCIPVAYAPELADQPLKEVAPRFHALLRRMCAAPGEATDEVAERRYQAVTRWLGYQLHGSNPEKKMGVFVGATDIGKNQAVEVPGELLGSNLAWLAGRPTLLTKTRGDRHDGEESKLAGTRMVLVNELTSKQHLDEGQVLRHVNPEGTTVSLRRMRQDPMTVAVTWKITVSTNELPHANMTPQVKNRLLIFALSSVPVPKHEQYDIKRAILDHEVEAVLAHLVKWWREWYLAKSEEGSATGLVITDEMRALVNDYEEDNQDPHVVFFEECCVLDPAATLDNVNPVWLAYQEWHRALYPDQDIRFAIGRNKFGNAVESLPGVERLRETSGGKTRVRGLRGIRVLPKDQWRGPEDQLLRWAQGM
jgi:phage/plasmid-associated DNA primase